nr:phage tail spike protein [Leuconostoc mesenteroides]
MDYLARQGADTSKVFASGSNLLTVERQSDTSGIYTAILPRGKGKEIDNGDADTPDGYGRRINIADVEWKKSAGKPLDKPKGSIVLSDPDATTEWGQINGNARLLLQTYDDIDDVNVLINSAYKTLQSVNHPQIQYSATVADVGGLSLGDTVLIMHGDRDLSYKTRVFEVKYDLLSPEQTELSLGDDLSSNSITSQINNLNAVADTTSSQTQWTINQIGRPSTTFGNTEPANPKVGDVFFKELPDGGTEIHRWNGNIWELLASPTTADDIAKAVNDAVTQAKAHTDEVKQGLSSDIETAKSQAASLASTAEANAKSEATSLFGQAQNALSDAKTDLTKSIASEASARNQAVAAANSQAQNYVNQAKSDINDTINAFSVGGRNYVLNSNVSTTSNITGFYSSVPSSYFNNKKITVSVQLDYDNITALSALNRLGVEFVILNKDGSNRYIGSWKYPAIGDSFHGRIYTTFDFSNNEFKDYANNQMGQGIYVQGPIGTNVSVSKPKLKIGNKPTDWTPAPEDVVLDYTTKDNKIKETIAQYQETTNGHVSRLQTDVTTALGQIATKISKTDYDQKTGELSSNINDVKETADKSAQTIADIQEANGKRDSRISEVERTAGEIKSTVSDISTAQDKQSGFISTLKQRADEFDATVTKVDNLSVGGRNLLLGTRDWTDNTRWNQENTVTKDVYRVMVIASSGSAWTSPVYMMQNAGILQVGKTYTFSTYVRNTSDTDTKVASYYEGGIVTPIGTATSLPAHTDWFRVSITFQCVKDPTTSTANLRWEGQNALTNGFIQFAGYKLEEGNQATDWTPAPEDVDSATAKAQLTANEASAAISKLTSADGIITKAQADIKANADAITQKVSKTVYDQKTGDLTQAISKAQSTADGAASTVGNYKTSNDKRVEAAESKIEQNSKDITARVSQTDYDNNNSKLSERFTKVEATADGASTTVGKLQTAVNNLGQINRLLNTEFNPDYAAWTAYGNVTTLSIDRYWLQNGSNNLGVSRDQDQSNYGYATQKIAIGQNTTFSFSVNAKINSMISSKGRLYIHLRALDANGNMISDIYKSGDKSTTINFESFSVQNAQTPAGTTVVELAIGMYGGGSVSFNHPFFVLDSHLGNYVAGNYSNSDYLAQVKITADNISNFVRDSIGNISSDFQTALSKTSIITGSTLASSIQKQTASQISSALTDNNGKIISLINQDSSGVQIAGNNIVLNGDTTVTGTFKVSQANIANGAIGTAQIGDASITSAKIISLDVARLTGNVSNFIQSNWNGVYGSTTITSSGMTIVSPGTVALFNVNGMTLDGAGGMTRVANGFTQIYSATHENIGMIGHQKDVDHDNVDYITFGLNGYRTTNEGDSHWVGGSDFYGGDGMGFGVSNKKGTYDLKLRWDSDLIAGYKGELQGWHASDQFIFDNKTFHKGYADFSGGVTLSGAYAEGTRSLHTQGMSMSTGAKWFGFMDGSNSTGFGTDQTQDVLFYVKGQVYSLYTMLGKLGMR